MKILPEICIACPWKFGKSVTISLSQQLPPQQIVLSLGVIIQTHTDPSFRQAEPTPRLFVSFRVD